MSNKLEESSYVDSRDLNKDFVISIIGPLGYLQIKNHNCVYIRTIHILILLRT